MEEYLLLDKSLIPDDEQLKSVMGKNFPYLQEIRDHISKTYGDVTEEWKFYSKKSGWVMKTLYKKRNLFFFKPYNGYFNITFVFGNKAVDAVVKSDVNEDLKEILRNAKKYAEGRGLQVKVSSKKYIKDIKKLLAIKISN